MYLVPIIIVIGLVTNILSFCVFLSRHIRLQSSSIYLAWLAVSDSFVLLMTSASWLSWIRIMWVHQEGVCQIVIYGTYVWAFISVWTVVAFTVDRYIVVCHPLSRMSMCTRRRAKIVACAISLAAVLLYSYSLVTIKVYESAGMQYCGDDHRYKFFIKLMVYVDLAVTLIIPSIAILALNSRITYTIYRFLKNRPSEGRLQSSSSSSSSRSTHNIGSSKERRQTRSKSTIMVTWRGSPCHGAGLRANPSSQGFPQMRTTRMLIVVSLVFIFLNVPSHGLRLYLTIITDLKLGTVSAVTQRVKEILEIVYYINFSTNFFLYSLCMKSFRQATQKLIVKACVSIKRAIFWAPRALWLKCRKNTLTTINRGVDYELKVGTLIPDTA